MGVSGRVRGGNSKMSLTFTTRSLASLRRSAPLAVSARANHGGKQSGDQGQQGPAAGPGAGAGLALVAGLALAAKAYSERDRMQLKAESPEVQAHENRVRTYMQRDKIFNYFASFQHISSTGKRDMMMTPMDFYASITPDCNKFGAMAGVHVTVPEAEVAAGTYYWGKSAVKDSLLNKIGENGLITYADYCLLLALISTPKRFIGTVFNLLDVTGDGNIETKEFAFVTTKMAIKEGGFGTYTDHDQKEILASKSSGLINYIYGKDRKGTLNKVQFSKLQADLLDEIIQLEFNEYDKETSGRISERDLCHFLLRNSKIPPKKQAAMLKRVEKIWPSKGRGVSLPSFGNLFHVLAGGVELERALFLLDCENIGVDVEEFRKVASWVSHQELSDHVAAVLFTLLDDDQSGRLTKEDVSAVFGDWRASRSFDKGAFQVSLGQLRI